MGNKLYLEENSELMKNILDRSFFEAWSGERGVGEPNYNTIELMLTSDCNLNCKYCYLKRFEDGLYPPEMRDDHVQMLKNTRMIIEWLIENKYTPNIDFYAGSPLSQEITLQCLELIHDIYIDTDIELRPKFITIPTNYTFLLSEKWTIRVRKLLDSFNNLDIKVGLSASVDGALMDQNRPFAKKELDGLFMPKEDIRDDAFYEKVFKWNKEFGFGFHPMIYSKDVGLWKDNFLWFQEKLEKHGFPFNAMYLLEVRNEEWNSEQMKQFAEFINFIIKWSWEKVGKDPEKFTNFLFTGHGGFNILRGSISGKHRGSSCALQTQLYVRVGDLSIVPCHRMSYESYNYGGFIIKDDKIVDIAANNVEFMVSINQYQSTTQPYCEACAIKNVCMGQCLGAQLEVTGDPFTPIPTVCELTHVKIYAILRAFKEIGVYDRVCGLMNNDLVEVFDRIMED